MIDLYRSNRRLDGLFLGEGAELGRNGNLVLMAENQKEYDRPLSGFKRRYRKASGSGRLKRGADVPIAVLVSRVTIKRRLDVIGVIQRRIPELGAAIERQLKILD